MTSRVYILGGYQTDFADNWARNGMEIAEAMRVTIMRGLAETNLVPSDVEVAHIGNFAAELFCNQGHLGGLFAASDPAFAGIPSSRHEAACASGSLALLAAGADIEAGRYGLAAVLGVQQMRNVPEIRRRSSSVVRRCGAAMSIRMLAINGHECSAI